MAEVSAAAASFFFDVPFSLFCGFHAAYSTDAHHTHHMDSKLYVFPYNASPLNIIKHITLN